MGRALLMGLAGAANGYVRGLQYTHDIERQNKLDARVDVENAQKDSEFNYRVAERQGVDTAFNSYASQQKGIYNGQQADFSGTAPSADQGPVPQDQMAPVTGMRPQGSDPTAPAPALISRKATDRDDWNGRRDIAIAKKDAAALGVLHTEGKELDWNEGLTKHAKAWTAMDDTAKAALIKKISDDTGVKGNGTWVPGTGKQAGYMNYLPPGSDAIRLSDKEAGQVYALNNMMELNPTRAREAMDKVSDKVATMASHLFESQTKGVTLNNAATHHGNADALGNRKADEDSRHHKAQEGIMRTSAENRAPREADPKLVAEGNALYAQLRNEPDAAKRKLITAQLAVNESLVATSMGKVLRVNEPKQTFTEADVENLTQQHLNPKRNPNAAQFAAQPMHIQRAQILGILNNASDGEFGNAKGIYDEANAKIAAAAAAAKAADKGAAAKIPDPRVAELKGRQTAGLGTQGMRGPQDGAYLSETWDRWAAEREQRKRQWDGN